MSAAIQGPGPNGMDGTMAGRDPGSGCQVRANRWLLPGPIVYCKLYHGLWYVSTQPTLSLFLMSTGGRRWMSEVPPLCMRYRRNGHRFCPWRREYLCMNQWCSIRLADRDRGQWHLDEWEELRRLAVTWMPLPSSKSPRTRVSSDGAAGPTRLGVTKAMIQAAVYISQDPGKPSTSGVYPPRYKGPDAVCHRALDMFYETPRPGFKAAHAGPQQTLYPRDAPISNPAGTPGLPMPSQGQSDQPPTLTSWQIPWPCHYNLAIQASWSLCAHPSLQRRQQFKPEVALVSIPSTEAARCADLGSTLARDIKGSMEGGKGTGPYALLEYCAGPWRGTSKAAGQSHGLLQVRHCDSDCDSRRRLGEEKGHATIMTGDIYCRHRMDDSRLCWQVRRLSSTSAGTWTWCTVPRQRTGRPALAEGPKTQE